jgi:hypothetical protein
MTSNRKDLADLDSVAAAADDVATRVDRLDILLNNAGVMAIPLRRTAQGHEAQPAPTTSATSPSPDGCCPCCSPPASPVSSLRRRSCTTWGACAGRTPTGSGATGSGRRTGSRSWRTCCSLSSWTAGPGRRALRAAWFAEEGPSREARLPRRRCGAPVAGVGGSDGVRVLLGVSWLRIGRRTVSRRARTGGWQGLHRWGPSARTPADPP